MPKVFIINKGCHNYDDAKRFGEFEILSDGPINRYAVGVMYRDFWAKLKDSSPEDYILISGLSVMTGLACAIFAAFHSRLNILIYKASRSGKGEYVDRTIIIEGKEGEDADRKDT